jgi:hypothetical protein
MKSYHASSIFDIFKILKYVLQYTSSVAGSYIDLYLLGFAIFCCCWLNDLYRALSKCYSRACIILNIDIITWSISSNRYKNVNSPSFFFWFFFFLLLLFWQFPHESHRLYQVATWNISCVSEIIFAIRNCIEREKPTQTWNSTNGASGSAMYGIYSLNCAMRRSVGIFPKLETRSISKVFNSIWYIQDSD